MYVYWRQYIQLYTHIFLFCTFFNLLPDLCTDLLSIYRLCALFRSFSPPHAIFPKIYILLFISDACRAIQCTHRWYKNHHWYHNKLLYKKNVKKNGPPPRKRHFPRMSRKWAHLTLTCWGFLGRHFFRLLFYTKSLKGSLVKVYKLITCLRCAVVALEGSVAPYMPIFCRWKQKKWMWENLDYGVKEAFYSSFDHRNRFFGWCLP